MQLKATDSKDINKIERYRFAKKKINQLCNYSIPVLIVRYSSHYERFYFVWVDKIPLVNARIKTKTVPLNLSEDNIWNDNTCNEIEQYLVRLEKLKQGRVRLPIKTFIENYGVSTTTIVGLRKALTEFAQFIRIEREKTNADFFVHFKKNELIPSLLYEFGSSFGDEGGIAEMPSSKLAKLVVLGLAITLVQAEKHLEVQKITSDENIKEELIKRPKVLSFLVPSLLSNEDSIEDNINFILSCIEKTEDFSLEIFTNISILLLEKVNSEKIQNQVFEFHNRILKQAKSQDISSKIAVSYYNLGKFKMNMEDCVSAVGYFNKARKHNEEYLKLDYFLKDLGGALFETSRYNLSALFYKLAIERGHELPIITALYADALLYCGQYEEAKLEFSKSVLDDSINLEYKYEWYLKYVCLVSLLNIGFPKTQKRNSIEADRLADPKNFKGNIHNQLEKALENDMLSSLAWYNFGDVNMKDGDIMMGFISFLMAGLINGRDIEAWVNATLIAYRTTGESDLLTSIANTAYFHCNESYLEDLNKQWQKTKKEGEEEIDKVINKLIKNSHDDTAEFRLHGDDGEILKIYFDKNKSV